ncbi:MAG: hypothetical protein BAJALOKI3v1_1100009 [Promethearchaeota archaeon]|nr:MAG: hypothetical protein BAJALOKI3v1_1100009 [Candidatus Lokiarchaeota archaeon]
MEDSNILNRNDFHARFKLEHGFDNLLTAIAKNYNTSNLGEKRKTIYGLILSLGFNIRNES